jgi:hypothetical protein
MPPLVSVVIVNFNGKKFLNDCLSSLIRQTFRDFEVIVVDNGSSDSSVDFIRERYPSVILVETGKNLGFAGGTNAGIRIAQGAFIFTLNNDTIADPHLIEEIVKPMLADPRVGMCGTKMVFPDGRINSTAICFSRSGAAWDRGRGEPDHGQYDTPEEIFGPCAGAALYRRAMMDDVGLFDEDFFLFMEDVDLAFRGRLAGWTCRFVPAAQVVHIQGGTSGVKSDTAIYYGNRNIGWFVIKNYPKKILFLSMPFIIGRNIGAIPYFLMQGKLRTILRSKIDLILGLNEMYIKRRAMQKTIYADITIVRWILPWAKNSLS